jgi:sugar phosphate isomerase/epimerase
MRRGDARAAGAGSIAGVRIAQVALQLYNLRDFCRTAGELAATARRVKAIGYSAVQISNIGPIDERDIVRICADEGLVICATHEPGSAIIDETDKVIDRLQRLGTRYTAYPHPHLPVSTVEEVLALASALDKAGRALRKAGLVLTYHNHALELRKFDGQTMLDMIFAHTGRQYVQAEIDTYWIQAGGGDPAEWCRKLKRRIPLLHIKDYGVSSDDKAGTMMEIGSGNLNWPAIISAADKSGCEWFIVEQDVCPGDPFESARISFEYIKRHLAQDTAGRW